MGTFEVTVIKETITPLYLTTASSDPKTGYVKPSGYLRTIYDTK